MQNDNSTLKKAVKELHKKLQQQIAKNQTNTNEITQERENKMRSLEIEMAEKEKIHADNVAKLKNDIATMAEKHVEELDAVQEQLEITQDNHGRDLSKLFDALHFTQNLSMDDDKKEEIEDSSITIYDKDYPQSYDEMAELRKEVEALKKMHASDIIELQRRLARRCRVCGAANATGVWDGVQELRINYNE